MLTIRIKSDPKAITYVAFTYPYTYKELQSYLGRIEKRFNCLDKTYEDLTSQSTNNSIYFHRENLCYSVENRRVDLVTISGTSGILVERESELSNLYPPSRAGSANRQTNPATSKLLIEKNVKNSKNDIRPFKFHNKKIVFVSARVHPGETQSSFVMRGFIKFLLRPNDPRAVMLRKKYVFKLVPMLNPDGVVKGHYRTDSNGVNLNRVYARPDVGLHPTIYAARKLLLYSHHGKEVEEHFESETDDPLTADDGDMEESESISRKNSMTMTQNQFAMTKNDSTPTTVFLTRGGHEKMSVSVKRRSSFGEIPNYISTSTASYIQPTSLQPHLGSRTIKIDDDNFLEPSDALRIRRDSARSGEHTVVGSSHSDAR